MKNILYCVVTGEELVRTPSAIQKLVQKYGFADEKQLRDQYIGQTGRKLLKSGKTVEEIRESTGCGYTNPITDETLIRLGIKKVKYV